jgi:hypothetical protein
VDVVPAGVATPPHLGPQPIYDLCRTRFTRRLGQQREAEELAEAAASAAAAEKAARAARERHEASYAIWLKKTRHAVNSVDRISGLVQVMALCARDPWSTGALSQLFVDADLASALLPEVWPDADAYRNSPVQWTMPEVLAWFAAKRLGPLAIQPNDVWISRKRFGMESRRRTRGWLLDSASTVPNDQWDTRPAPYYGILITQDGRVLQDSRIGINHLRPIRDEKIGHNFNGWGLAQLARIVGLPLTPPP